MASTTDDFSNSGLFIFSAAGCMQVRIFHLEHPRRPSRHGVYLFCRQGMVGVICRQSPACFTQWLYHVTVCQRVPRFGAQGAHYQDKVPSDLVKVNAAASTGAPVPTPQLHQNNRLTSHNNPAHNQNLLGRLQMQTAHVEIGPL